MIATLSPTLDSVGILARTVANIMALDGLLAVGPRRNGNHDNAIRAVVPEGEWIDDCTSGVRDLFGGATDALRDNGITVEVAPMTSLSDAQRSMDAHRTIVGAEAYARYGHLLSAQASIEPATKRRLARNVASVETVKSVCLAMPLLRRRLVTELAGAVLLCPTVRHEPPRLDGVLASDDLYDVRNASTRRTTMVLSYLGMCSISLPLRGRDGCSTAGLMASLPHRLARRPPHA